MSPDPPTPIEVLTKEKKSFPPQKMYNFNDTICEEICQLVYRICQVIHLQ
jgi:hypothetical protein